MTTPTRTRTIPRKTTRWADSCASVIVASEPLTRDPSTWIEVPEYSMIYVARDTGQWHVETRPLDV